MDALSNSQTFIASDAKDSYPPLTPSCQTVALAHLVRYRLATDHAHAPRACQASM